MGKTLTPEVGSTEANRQVESEKKEENKRSLGRTTQGPVESCFSKHSPWTSSIHISQEPIKNLSSWAPPRPTESNLHFNKIMCIFKFEKHRVGHISTYIPEPLLASEGEGLWDPGSAPASAQLPLGSGSHVSTSIPSANLGARGTGGSLQPLKLTDKLYSGRDFPSARSPLPKVKDLLYPLPRM